MKRGLVGNETSLTDFFSLTLYGTGYVSAVEKVLSGEVEAAAVSDYVYRGDNKYLDDTQKEIKSLSRTRACSCPHALRKINDVRKRPKNHQRSSITNE